MRRGLFLVIAATTLASACVDAGAAFDPEVAPTASSVTQTSAGVESKDTSPKTASSKLTPDDVAFYLRVPELAVPKMDAMVDVIGTFEVRAAKPTVPGEEATAESPATKPEYEVKSVSMPLVQQARVIDLPASNGTLAPVGLALSVDQAEALMLFEQRGKLTLLERSKDDIEMVPIMKTTLRSAVEDAEVMQEKRMIRRKSRSGGGVGLQHGERSIVLGHSLPFGVLTPDTHVNIHGVFDIPIKSGSQVSVSMLQNVKVLDVDGDAVKLAVTVEEALALAVAADQGKLVYTVRNRESVEIQTVSRKTLREVLEDLEVIQEKRMIRIRRKRKPRPKSASIEIITGGGGGGYAAPYVPADQNTESYDNPGQNGWVTTAKDNLSTFAADVDTGSYTIARRKLREGTRPPVDSVRPEEWINYFTYNYPQPTDGPFGISIEAAPSPFQTSSQYRLVRFGVQAKSLPAEGRKPMHLTFLVDVSGSMNSADKLGLAVRALKQLVLSLKSDDTVAIATYAGRTVTLLPPTRAESRGEIMAAIDLLQSGGGTAMNDGLQQAYALATQAFVSGHENRVIVMSDGDANVGRTSVDDMHRTIEQGAKQGVTLSTIGFGMGNYKDAAMEQLANKGDGNYYYIDGIDEARRVFGEQLNATLMTVARDVKLQVEFDPKVVSRYRLIGYENRDIADKDFRNDSVDAGEMGAGHSVTALYEVEMVEGADEGQLATLRIRHRAPDDKGPTLETTASLDVQNAADKLTRTSYSFRWAAAVAAFAELARKSPYAKHVNLDWVHEVAKGAVADREDRAEMLGLINRARKLF